MSDDWLWDGQGEPDETEARLVRTLSTLRYRPPSQPKQAPVWPGLLAAAVVLLGAFGLWQAQRSAVPWGVFEGPCPDDDCWLAAGEWVEPEAAFSAQLADIGRLDVTANSRLRVVATSASEHRLELARGQIRAEVDAPPRLLIFETPSTTVVDLGCAYLLRVADDGSTAITVESGHVALEGGRLPLHVVAGASARVSASGEASVPVFDDADPAHKAALLTLAADPSDTRALTVAIDTARPADTLSLWHLLPRVEQAGRAAIVDRMVALDPPLGGRVDRRAVIAGDPDAIERLETELIFLWGFR